ncbi:hypothetical protein BC943DRAFT_327562 [Umbelopsis sp. AD052]|nr:hypothetical protein BC943DRAFT_327562 [Umbelopsis sp. AD052]
MTMNCSDRPLLKFLSFPTKIFASYLVSINLPKFRPTASAKNLVSRSSLAHCSNCNVKQCYRLKCGIHFDVLLQSASCRNKKHTCVRQTNYVYILYLLNKHSSPAKDSASKAKLYQEYFDPLSLVISLDTAKRGQYQYCLLVPWGRAFNVVWIFDDCSHP